MMRIGFLRQVFALHPFTSIVGLLLLRDYRRSSQLIFDPLAICSTRVLPFILRQIDYDESLPLPVCTW